MLKKKRKKMSTDPLDMEYGDSYDSYGNDPFSDTNDNSGDVYGGDVYGGDVYGGDDPIPPKRPKTNPLVTVLKAVVAVIVVLVLVGGILSGVGALVGPTKGQCKDTIEQTEYSLNTMDVNGLCDVINPMIGRKLKALIMVANMLTPEDAASYIESAIDQLGGSILPEGMDAADVLEEIEIEPYRFGLPGKTRKVKCNLIFAGSTYAKVEIHLKKAEGEVYISKIKSVNE